MRGLASTCPIRTTTIVILPIIIIIIYYKYPLCATATFVVVYFYDISAINTQITAGEYMNNRRKDDEMLHKRNLHTYIFLFVSNCTENY